jgi:hypothetical protein
VRRVEQLTVRRQQATAVQQALALRQAEATRNRPLAKVHGFAGTSRLHALAVLHEYMEEHKATAAQATTNQATAVFPKAPLRCHVRHRHRPLSQLFLYTRNPSRMIFAPWLIAFIRPLMVGEFCPSKRSRASCGIHIGKAARYTYAPCIAPMRA